MARRKQAADDQVIEPIVADQSYVVVWTVKHNGRRYEPGEAIELDQASADRLIATGAIRAASTE